jgi:hypothetical protein
LKLVTADGGEEVSRLAVTGMDSDVRDGLENQKNDEGNLQGTKRPMSVTRMYSVYLHIPSGVIQDPRNLPHV